MLASVGLVHLNGRVYDPYIGRMTSADPVVGDPLNGQTWNRYSYVFNNPLAYTDPTGYCPVCIQTVRPPPQPNWFARHPLFGSLLRIAIGSICMVALTPTGCAPFMPLFAFVGAAAVAGLNGGKFIDAMHAGAISMIQSIAFYAVGGATAPNLGLDTPGRFLANVLGHALVGCASSAASGGKCGPGALAAGVTAFAGPIINKLPFQAALLTNATLGGLVSVAGGGKFANGAVTAAFGYLSNACLHGSGGCNRNMDGDLAGLPEQLRWSIGRLGVMIYATGDSDLIDRFNGWQIAYNSQLTGNIWGATNYDTQTTVFYRDVTKLTGAELDFLVAHEFAHLTPENQALGPPTIDEAFRNPFGYPPQEQAADAFARWILQIDQNPGRFMSRK